MTFLRLEKAFREGSACSGRKAGALIKAIQILIVMKLTLLIIMVACLQGQAKTGYGQERITLSEKNADLETVLHKISLQSGYQCFYKTQWLKEARKVTIEISNGSLGDALAICFKDQPVTYSIVNKTIVVKTKQISEESPAANETEKTVKAQGTVYSEAGQPLSGASVMVKVSGKTTLTNAKGEFSFSAGVPVNSILVVSFIGYSSKQVTIKEAVPVQVYLSVAINELDEEVIQAYGKTSRRLATGNIAKVTATEIEKQPVMNPLQALQGQVAGLVITPFTGNVSGLFQVVIRGQNTIGNFPLDPLYVIDGVPLTVLGVGNNDQAAFGSVGFDQTGMSPAIGQSPFFSLNPADIESIEVLKDADATAIYGSRGANGAILFTTKKGKAGRTKFDVNVYQGVSEVTKNWDMLNTKQYLSMRREAFKNDSIIPDAASAPDLFIWDTTRYTDWQKFLWGKMGKTTDAQVSLSGGDARTTFRIGGGYHRETDITTYSGANQRGSVSFGLTHKTANQRLGISFISNYSFAEANMISIPGAAVLPPDAPAVFDSKGNLNYAEWDAKSGSFPFASLLQPYTAKTNFLTSNLSFNYQLIKGLFLRASLGYNNAQNSQSSFQPIASLDTYQNPNIPGSARFGNTKNNNWIIEPQVEYNGLINKGKINILLGGSAQATTTEGLSVAGSGYTNDALLRTISNAVTVASSDNYGQYKYSAVFGRINYNWENKYILNLNARRDGSSRFGPGKQFGNFGSVGAAWIFTEEAWLKEHIEFVSFGKLRASYGITGADAVGDYAYLTRWSANGLPTYDRISALTPLQHSNTNYHWESNHKLEAAMDLGFLHDRLSVEAAYYRNRCNDQLLSFPTAAFTGFTSVPAANWPANVQNKGWEFLVNAQVVKTKKFSWAVNFNIAINRNKLLAYPNQAQSPYANSLIVGQPISIIKLLHLTGVDPKTGQYTFQDKNKDGRIIATNDSTGDMYPYDPTPKFTGGFGSTFSYQNLSLSAFFYFKKQKGYNALTASGGNPPGTMFNQSAYIYAHRWQQPGDITNVARFTTLSTALYTDLLSSDGYLTDASFIRLANLSVSYSLPGRLSAKAGIQGLRIFMNAQNLVVITKYKGLDPESQNFGGMPPAKIITGGVSLNF